MSLKAAPLLYYWTFAGAVALGFYYLCIRIGTSHTSDRSKEVLSKWLSGEYESTWAKHFCNLFDRVFGENHLSWKRFKNSAIASILSVALIYILFGKVLGVLARAPEGMTLRQALVLGAVINVVPDFVSLIETRFILKYIEKVHSIFGHIAILLADVVFTSLIIFLAIDAFQWSFGYARLSVVETLAMFSIFSVFFYSTFLTSVWAWLYCVSTWFVRVFSKTPLKTMLNIKDKPEAQIGLVGMIVIFAIAGMAKPIFETSSQSSVTRFDAMLCDFFPAEICPHIARLTEDDRLALKYLAKTCAGGEIERCIGDALEYYEGDYSEATSLFERTCKVGYASGCNNLGYMYREGLGVEQDYSKAVWLFELTCDGGLTTACHNLGVMYEKSLGVDQDYPAAIRLYRMACSNGFSPGCNALGALYEKGLGVEQNNVEAASLYKTACNGGYIVACSNLGYMYQEGLGVEQAEVKAVSLYKTACEGGDNVGCGNLGVMYQTGQGVEQDNVKAVSLYKMACEGGDNVACSNLGYMYQEGLGVEQDEVKAVSLYRTACEGGHASACTQF